jgi:hypothetical protein
MVTRAVSTACRLQLKQDVTRGRARMDQRAAMTGYFLNRVLGYLALIANGVRFPSSIGVWLPVAEAERAPWEVSQFLSVVYPGEIDEKLPFIALLQDDDVRDFEQELGERGMLADRAAG